MPACTERATDRRPYSAKCANSNRVVTGCSSHYVTESGWYRLRLQTRLPISRGGIPVIQAVARTRKSAGGPMTLPRPLETKRLGRDPARLTALVFGTDQERARRSRLPAAEPTRLSPHAAQPHLITAIALRNRPEAPDRAFSGLPPVPPGNRSR